MDSTDYDALLASAKADLISVNAKIARLQGTPTGNALVEGVNQHFHMGMVGGSGNRRNLDRLNSGRERSLQRTIDRSKILVPLYQQRDSLTALIESIESGDRQRRDEARARGERFNLESLVQGWINLKVGDELPLGHSPGRNPVITKKNPKSLYTGNSPDAKWTRAQIIGKEADQRFDEIARAIAAKPAKPNT
ncbi:MAG TPA: hypothetical protein V6C57_26390 [Coleofasciculaceae cyanobacterium]